MAVVWLLRIIGTLTNLLPLILNLLDIPIVVHFKIQGISDMGGGRFQYLGRGLSPSEVGSGKIVKGLMVTGLGFGKHRGAWIFCKMRSIKSVREDRQS